MSLVVYDGEGGSDMTIIGASIEQLTHRELLLSVAVGDWLGLDSALCPKQLGSRIARWGSGGMGRRRD